METTGQRMKKELMVDIRAIKAENPKRSQFDLLCIIGVRLGLSQRTARRYLLELEVADE